MEFKAFFVAPPSLSTNASFYFLGRLRVARFCFISPFSCCAPSIHSVLVSHSYFIHALSQASCSVTMLAFTSGARAFSSIPPPATGIAPLLPFASPAGRNQHHPYQRHDHQRQCFRHRSSSSASPGGGSVVVGAAARRRRNAGVGVLRCSEGTVSSTPDHQVSFARVGCVALHCTWFPYLVPRR